MTRIEVLFPEFCSLFADSSNIRYLENVCLMRNLCSRLIWMSRCL